MNERILAYLSSWAARSRRGGESGIRTHGTLSGTRALQARAFSRSAISPSTRRELRRLCWARAQMSWKWRRGGDSNPRYGFWPYNGLANRRLQPLGHLSARDITYRNLATFRDSSSQAVLPPLRSPNTEGAVAPERRARHVHPLPSVRSRSDYSTAQSGSYARLMPESAGKLATPYVGGAAAKGSWKLRTCCSCGRALMVGVRVDGGVHHPQRLRPPFRKCLVSATLFAFRGAGGPNLKA